MRPGPIGPGIFQRRGQGQQGIDASMRPGPIGPGIYLADIAAAIQTDCFNEAGANWPRNWRCAGFMA